MVSSSLESTPRRGVIEGYGNPVWLAGWGATRENLHARQPIRACKYDGPDGLVTPARSYVSALGIQDPFVLLFVH